MLAGLSAGAMCWFEGGITRSSGPPQTIEGLGLLPGSLTVHADGEPERLPAFMDAVRTGQLPGGWAADDGVGLLFRGHGARAGGLLARRAPRAMRLDAVDGELVRRRVEPELLGAAPAGCRAGGRREELRAVPAAPAGAGERGRREASDELCRLVGGLASPVAGQATFPDGPPKWPAADSLPDRAARRMDSGTNFERRARPFVG